MKLPKTVKIAEVEGGKQVQIINVMTGKPAFASRTLFSSMDGTENPHLQKFIEDGVANGFNLDEFEGVPA